MWNGSKVHKSLVGEKVGEKKSLEFYFKKQLSGANEKMFVCSFSLKTVLS